jgi:heme-degrading monooxygenase HmoA
VYIWESEEALQQWRDTNLAGTLAETYQVTEGPTSEVAEVMLVLHGNKNPL